MAQKTNTKPRARSKSVSYLLDSGSLNDIEAASKLTAELIEYHWRYYSELAYQRNLIQQEIQESLIQTCTPFEVKQMQRAVKYKYSLHPLSTNGSITFSGGRFNTGKDVHSEVPYFPGLYLAANKDTALQEHLGQEANSRLTPREVALTNPSSEAIVSISGKIDCVFDLRNSENLTPFMQLIRNFSIPKQLTSLAKKLGENPPSTVQDVSTLHDTLMALDWRIYPTMYDVPSNSQIFGHLVYQAGIEGIIYNSKLTGDMCLIAFPRNFANTDSYLAIDDEAPDSKVPSRIDSSNWRVCELNYNEL